LSSRRSPDQGQPASHPDVPALWRKNHIQSQSKLPVTLNAFQRRPRYARPACLPKIAVVAE